MRKVQQYIYMLSCAQFILPFTKGEKYNVGFIMLIYDKNLKVLARKLRSSMTEHEVILWSRLKNKQVLNIQFYRQRSLGRYIADFYAPKINLVIELDGSQHYETEHAERDFIRDEFLASQGVATLRFSNHEIMRDLEQVLQQIYYYAENYLFFSLCKGSTRASSEGEGF